MCIFARSSFFLFFSLVGLGFELCTLQVQSHTSSPFWSGYFGDGFSGTIGPGWPQTVIL
jgi:hypothetical protein